MTIIIAEKDKTAVKVDKCQFRNEAAIQDFINKNPDTIPIYELDEEKKLLVVAREFATNSGPIDALALDQNGDIYIIETKLFKNPDKRTVVAQALDYGAALWRHLVDFTEFLERLDTECRSKFSQSFEERFTKYFELDVDQYSFVIQAIRQNLNDGNLKFVILMDEIDERLRDMIVYVNQNSQFDIYAVQLRYYRHEKFEIVIPKLFGVEVKKKIKGPSDIKKWNEISWLKAFKEKRSSDEIEIVEKFKHWASKKEISYGYSSMRRDYRATLWVSLDQGTASYSLFGFRMDGKIEFRLTNLKDQPPFDDESIRLQFVNQLNKIPGVSISTDERTLRGVPSFPINFLIDDLAFNPFCETIDWCIQLAKENSTN